MVNSTQKLWVREYDERYLRSRPERIYFVIALLSFLPCSLYQIKQVRDFRPYRTIWFSQPRSHEHDYRRIYILTIGSQDLQNLRSSNPSQKAALTYRKSLCGHTWTIKATLHTLIVRSAQVDPRHTYTYISLFRSIEPGTITTLRKAEKQWLSCTSLRRESV